MSKLLVETTSVPEATSKPGRWKAVLITPGKGSSANYSEKALRESGPKALRKGAKSFVTHNRTENGEPDPFRMWGFLAEDATYEDGVGLVGEIEVLPSYQDRIAEVAPHTALSVYVTGTVDDDNNLVEFSEDPQNGVDLVVYPGRPGSGLVEKLYESLTSVGHPAGNGTAPAGRQTEDKESDMEIKELGEKVETLVKSNDALTKSIEAFVGIATPILESLKPSEDSDAVDMAAIAEAARDLPEDIRKEVYATVEDKTQTEALAIVKARVDLVESIKKSLGENKAPVTPIGRATGEQGSGSEKFSLTKIGEKA